MQKVEGLQFARVLVENLQSVNNSSRMPVHFVAEISMEVSMLTS